MTDSINPKKISAPSISPDLEAGIKELESAAGELQGRKVEVPRGGLLGAIDQLTNYLHSTGNMNRIMGATLSFDALAEKVMNAVNDAAEMNPKALNALNRVEKALKQLRASTRDTKTQDELDHKLIGLTRGTLPTVIGKSAPLPKSAEQYAALAEDMFEWLKQLKSDMPWGEDAPLIHKAIQQLRQGNEEGVRGNVQTVFILIHKALSDRDSWYGASNPPVGLTFLLRYAPTLVTDYPEVVKEVFVPYFRDNLGLSWDQLYSMLRTEDNPHEGYSHFVSLGNHELDWGPGAENFLMMPTTPVQVKVSLEAYYLLAEAYGVE